MDAIVQFLNLPRGSFRVQFGPRKRSPITGVNVSLQVNELKLNIYRRYFVVVNHVCARHVKVLSLLLRVMTDAADRKRSQPQDRLKTFSWETVS